jgi:hypothetical protein
MVISASPSTTYWFLRPFQPAHIRNNEPDHEHCHAQEYNVLKTKLIMSVEATKPEVDAISEDVTKQHQEEG